MYGPLRFSICRDYLDIIQSFKCFVPLMMVMMQVRAAYVGGGAVDKALLIRGCKQVVVVAVMPVAKP